ncbi:MAG: hypothetical protein KDD33_05030 [Bdellovibrionales bacterium]|nr:hypothetical protein [Bdellovibrionales bacterium]
MKPIIAIIVLLMSPHLWGDNNIPAGQNDEATLAMGYDSEKQQLVGNCLAGKLERKGQQVANVSFEQSLDESQMSKELGIDAGTRFRYGEATVKASAKFLKASRKSGFSISAVYSGDYRFKNDILVFDESDKNLSASELEEKRLTAVGKAARTDDLKWRETCGNEYVAQIVRGAKLFYSIKIDFITQQEKDLFEAAFSYDSSFASVQAHLKNVSTNFSRRTKITVGALQIGGDTRRITEIFYDTTEPGNGSSLGFVQCSFGDLSKCDQVMANAIRYATKDFKEQLESKPDLPYYEGGPAELRYITKPYAVAGIYPKFSSILTGAVVAKRSELEAIFSNTMKDLGSVNSILNSSAIVLSTRQRKLLLSEKAKLEENRNKLVIAGETCYNSVPQCLNVADSMVAQLTDFDENSVIINPETFRQYCTVSDSPYIPAKLRKSIKGMLEAAKELAPDQFLPDPNGQSDDCLTASGVFSSHSVIKTFAGKGISELEPLAEYTHWVEVDLSNNEISDLSPLQAWDKIEALDLSDNKIRDINSLIYMMELRNLVIRNNRLRSIDELARLENLERVDARNNFDSVTCDNLIDVKTCFSATVKTDASFSPLSTDSLRPLFMPSVVDFKNGHFFVVSEARHGQEYEQSTNTFQLSIELNGSTRERVATLLEDGDVLITGGWGNGRYLGIYNPSTGQLLEDFKGMQVPRVGHTVTLLNNGKVLIAGGWEGGVSFTGADATYTAEIFDPVTNKTKVLHRMHAPRAWHTATLLDDGKVLITGGFRWNGGLATAEIFDPETERFTQLTSAMKEGRGAHKATLLPDGNVVITGGFSLDDKALNTAEVFNTHQKSFQLVPEPMTSERAMHEAILLNNGKVLLAGGSKEVLTPDHPLDFVPNTLVKEGELYDPVENSFMKVPSKMFTARAGHRLVEINPGTVMVLGGMTWASSVQLEVFNYVDVNQNNTPH